MNNQDYGKCTKCKNTYKLSVWYKRKIREAIKDRYAGIMVVCPICRDDTMYYIKYAKRDNVNVPKNLIRCPEMFCPGYLIIEDKPYIKKGVKVDVRNAARHCGECGRSFATRKALDDAIEKMVAKYAHRKMVYKKGKNGHWENVFPEKSKDSERYEELLEEIEMVDWDKEQAKKKSAKKTAKATGKSAIKKTSTKKSVKKKAT